MWVLLDKVQDDFTGTTRVLQELTNRTKNTQTDAWWSDLRRTLHLQANRLDGLWTKDGFRVKDKDINRLTDKILGSLVVGYKHLSIKQKQTKEELGLHVCVKECILTLGINQIENTLVWIKPIVNHCGFSTELNSLYR